VLGPQILVRSLNRPTIPDQYGNVWRYHSRSDRHSKIACWGILFDLLQACPTLTAQVAAGKVAFGINHEMSDFKVNRKKNLDLVICTPLDGTLTDRTFHDLVSEWKIQLNKAERGILGGLPRLQRGGVGAVHVALEAKACMTAHVRALPRLYDELNSSHLTIHGASDIAIAAGFAMINVAPEFISPDRNKHPLASTAPRVSTHRQPDDAIRAVKKVEEIRRRGRPGEEGFDALAIVVVDCRNDDTPVRLVSAAPAPSQSSILHYESMIRRVAQLYHSRFASL
jgi:hypothetical protein